METIYNINPNIYNSKYIIIYGAGTSGQKLLTQLLYDNVYINYFCDSNDKLWGQYVMNKQVISLQDLIKIKDESAVLVSSVYCVEIYDSLKELGINKVFFTHKDLFGSTKP